MKFENHNRNQSKCKRNNKKTVIISNDTKRLSNNAQKLDSENGKFAKEYNYQKIKIAIIVIAQATII